MAKKMDWIHDAVSKHPGALKKKAKHAGKSTKAFAREHEHDKGKTGKEARLAETLGKMRRGGKGERKAGRRGGRR